MTTDLMAPNVPSDAREASSILKIATSRSSDGCLFSSVARYLFLAWDWPGSTPLCSSLTIFLPAGKLYQTNTRVRKSAS